METDEDFVHEFEQSHSQWGEYVMRVSELIGQLLRDAQIEFHLIEQRVKSVASLKEKLRRPGKFYTTPRDIDDLAGVRIVLLDTLSVEKACKIIGREFKVNAESSSSKYEELAVDQFGYLSVHKIVKINDSRAGHVEWRKFKEMRAEIQVRTVLQHAWASVSHKLQYKREFDIPRQLRRRLIRLSGLFELADEEFLMLQQEDIKVRKTIGESVRRKAGGIPLDAASVNSWLAESNTVKAIRRIIIKDGENCGMIADDADETFTAVGTRQLLDAARSLKIATVAQLESELSSLRRPARDFFPCFSYSLRGRKTECTIGHLIAVLFVAANQAHFDGLDDYPFKDANYIETVRIAATRTLMQK